MKLKKYKVVFGNFRSKGEILPYEIQRRGYLLGIPTPIWFATGLIYKTQENAEKYVKWLNESEYT